MSDVRLPKIEFHVEIADALVPQVSGVGSGIKSADSDRKHDATESGV